MIDLTINKTPITSDDFQERKKKKESKQPINHISITTKGTKVTKPKRTVTRMTLSSSLNESLSPSQSLIPTQNKFELLDVETEQQSQRAKKPQPIIIPSVYNIQKMFVILNK
jgi:hypothetical protein